MLIPTFQEHEIQIDGPVYAKSLSAMDTREAKTHQYGIYISNDACRTFFDLKCARGANEDRPIFIHWPQTDSTSASMVKYYGEKTRNEARITSNLYKNGLITREDTGSVLVMWRHDLEDYEAIVLKTEDDINAFLGEYGLTPSDLGKVLELSGDQPNSLESSIQRYVEAIRDEKCPFPDSKDVSAAARICTQLSDERILAHPDDTIIDWTVAEYQIFRALEDLYYGEKIRTSFKDLDEFISLALSITNRRKSRAGHSFENQLEALFDTFGLSFDTQVKTEGNKKPDFIFPSETAYFDFEFPTEGLTVLAAKTTCKDRWRQVISEADRLRDGWKYLCTLQQGVSSAQMDEMLAEKVRLVCPAQYHRYFVKEHRSDLWTVNRFIRYMDDLQGRYSVSYGEHYHL